MDTNPSQRGGVRRGLPRMRCDGSGGSLRLLWPTFRRTASVAIAGLARANTIPLVRFGARIYRHGGRTRAIGLSCRRSGRSADTALLFHDQRGSLASLARCTAVEKKGSPAAGFTVPSRDEFDRLPRCPLARARRRVREHAAVRGGARRGCASGETSRTVCSFR